MSELIPLSTSASALGTPSATGSPVSDFNRDGYTDLLWRNRASGATQIWFMNGPNRTSVVSVEPTPDKNWHIQGSADFNRDGQTDILWRNYQTGENSLWLMNGTTPAQQISLTSVPDLDWQIRALGDFNRDGHLDLVWQHTKSMEVWLWLMNGTTSQQGVRLPDWPGQNLKIEGSGDFNRDGRVDLLWRNHLSGENAVWLMNGTTVTNTLFLPSVVDGNWQIQSIADWNQDGAIDLVWRHQTTGENAAWLLNGVTYIGSLGLPQLSDGAWSARSSVPDDRPPLTFGNLSFSQREGDRGIVSLQLTQAASRDVTITLEGSQFITVDADGEIQTGTQSSLTITPQNWQQPRRISFIAEIDDSSAHRVFDNTIRYTLSGGLTGSGVYNVGTVTNTSAPDPTRFNIDLDFRNDYEGFWTPERQAIARRAADTWASKIANEWRDLPLNHTLNRLDGSTARTKTFQSRRYVDDLVVFINPFPSGNGSEPALSGPDYEFGGWSSSPEAMPRVGQLALSSAVYRNQSDQVLYQVVLHELGHLLGLLGLNVTGNTLLNLADPATATFGGQYAKAANGGMEVPLASQDGVSVTDYYHPSRSVRSIMSYGYTYELTEPSAIDYAMLADSGYLVRGINA